MRIGKKSLAKRSEEGIVIGKCDETEGYKVYLPRSKTVIITQHISNVESTMEGANRFGNSKGRQQDLTEVDVKSRKNTKVQKKSITTATRPRSDLIKKDPRSKMVTRNLQTKASSQDVVSVLIEPDPKTYNQAMKSVKHV